MGRLRQETVAVPEMGLNAGECILDGGNELGLVGGGLHAELKTGIVGKAHYAVAEVDGIVFAALEDGDG